MTSLFRPAAAAEFRDFAVARATVRVPELRENEGSHGYAAALIAVRLGGKSRTGDTSAWCNLYVEAKEIVHL